MSSSDGEERGKRATSQIAVGGHAWTIQAWRPPEASTGGEARTHSVGPPRLAVEPSQHLLLRLLREHRPLGIAFGDQHFDDDGTDLELYEYWEGHLDAANRVYAVHTGDFLNNWLRFLGFLWGEQETRPPEAWELFKHYLPRFAPHSLAAVLGNHDLWNECGHFFKTMLEDYPMHVQPDAIRLEIRQPHTKPVTVSIRHRWKGHSQWNPAHAIMKAARFGHRDDLLIGGDYHISGEGKVVCPDTKRVTHCHQIASFKLIDRYADQLGLEDMHITPAQAFVVRPWFEQSDPRRVCRFDDPSDARAFLDAERDRYESRNQ